MLVPDEEIIFSSKVESRVIRRRASRLVRHIAVSPAKPKIRQLILTSHRLVSIKQRDRGDLSLKSELIFQSPSGSNNVSGKGKDKDKESRSHIIGVESKTEREFVVLTVCGLDL